MTEMKVHSKINNSKSNPSSLIRSGIKKLKSSGFTHVTPENILSDEVYTFFFTRFLLSQKGINKELDKQIDMLLSLIEEKA